jgi:Spy/CpxP family protein refolding chaperone
MKSTFQLSLVGAALLFLVTFANPAQAHPDGYWDHGGRWQHYRDYHHHHGYWDERNGTRVFISL